MVTLRNRVFHLIDFILDQPDPLRWRMTAWLGRELRDRMRGAPAEASDDELLRLIYCEWVILEIETHAALFPEVPGQPRGKLPLPCQRAEIARLDGRARLA